MVEAAFGDDVMTINGNADMEKADFVGGYVYQDQGKGEPQPVFIPGPLVEAMRDGKVLFVDDATLIPANVLPILYPMMDGRNRFLLTDHQGEEIIATDGFYICGAHNPGAPGAILAEPLSSRFGIHLIVDSDLQMALDMGINSNIVHFARSSRHSARRIDLLGS